MLSKPLAKGIATTEGILVYASNVVLAVAAVLPHGLSWTKTGVYAVILNSAYAISRSLVKVAAIQKGIGVPAPTPIDPVDPSAIGDIVQQVVSIVQPTAAATTEVKDSASNETQPPPAAPPQAAPAA